MPMPMPMPMRCDAMRCDARMVKIRRLPWPFASKLAPTQGIGAEKLE
jgi:hypothetical protein